jgi:hypothetical protein
MSAIASLYLLDRSAVPGLAQAAKAKPVMISAATHRWPRDQEIQEPNRLEEPNLVDHGAARIQLPQENHLGPVSK